jgi:glycosyltransferase involved in cell wall biosynthesis
MTIAIYTVIVSPHQLPLAREIAALVGADNYRYIFTEPFHKERRAMGWLDDSEPWIVSEKEEPALARKWLNDCDVLICGPRDLDLMESRARRGKLTFYANERWFKPIGLFHARLQIPGSIRMWHPGYRRMARRFVAMVKKYDSIKLLPFGVWARRDFLAIGVPEEKMMTWGYFVERGTGNGERGTRNGELCKILWVGRMLGWKRVDTIVNALRELCRDGSRSFSLTLVGNGPERERLVGLAKGLPVEFLKSVPIAEVRNLMRSHDVYVLSSNGQEGWGAALNEALEEKMLCIGTYEAGSSATILPDSNLYHAGDSHALAQLLRKASAGEVPWPGIGDWSVRKAAIKFLEMCK